MWFIRRITGNSMLPALRPGSFILARTKPVNIGDIVVATIDGREVVKRVHELSNGRVYLTGDNPSASTDSRTYGYISTSAIRGVVLFHVG